MVIRSIQVSFASRAVGVFPFCRPPVSGQKNTRRLHRRRDIRATRTSTCLSFRTGVVRELELPEVDEVHVAIAVIVGR